MKLIRNTTADGRCKYALVRLDKLRAMPQDSLIAASAAQSLDNLAALGFLEYGEKGSEEECFVIKLKDRFSAPALACYANTVSDDADDLVSDMGGLEEEDVEGLREYAKEVMKLSERAERWPNAKTPD